MYFQTFRFASLEFESAWERRILEECPGAIEYKGIPDQEIPIVSIMTDGGEKHSLQFNPDEVVLVIGDVVHIPKPRKRMET